jgi:hypothetical protein
VDHYRGLGLFDLIRELGHGAVRNLLAALLPQAVGKEKSLLRRLQAQTFPDATPPTGKIHPFSKIAATFKPVMQFECPAKLRISFKKLHSPFYK